MAIENIISTILCFSKHALGPRNFKKGQSTGGEGKKDGFENSWLLSAGLTPHHMHDEY